MRPLFNYENKTLSANGDWEITEPLNFILFRTGAEAVEVMIGDGEWIPTATGLLFKSDFGQLLGKVKFRSTAGGTVKVIYGLGCASFGGGTGGGLVGSGSPEGVVTADEGQTYYDTAGGGYWVKGSGNGTSTGWVQLIA